MDGSRVVKSGVQRVCYAYIRAAETRALRSKSAVKGGATIPLHPLGSFPRDRVLPVLT